MATPKKRTAKQLEKDSGEAAIVLPSVRSWSAWSPALIASAERQADSGNIRRVVDLCEWILGDDKVRGALDGRLRGFLDLPRTFEGKRKKPAKALEGEDDWDYMFSDTETWQIQAWAIVLGVGPGVCRWGRPPGHGDRDVPRIEFFHPQPLRHEHGKGWVRTVEGALDAPLTFGDGVWFGHMPFGTFRPWRLGLWRGLAPWVLLKHYAISDMGRLSEHGARIVVEIDKDRESKASDRRLLAASLKVLARDGSVVLPPGFTYKSVAIAPASKDLCVAQIEMANDAIAIAIRGANLSTNVDKGSFAAAKSQERTSELPTRRADAGAWSTTTHNQVLTYWADSNYGSPDLAPWVSYQTQPEEDRLAMAQTMNAALDMQTKAKALGYGVEHKEFLRAFNLDKLLTPPDPEAPTTSAQTPEEAAATPTKAKPTE